MINTSTLSSISAGLIKTIDKTDLSAANLEAINRFDASKKTTLGGSIGEVVTGIETLTEEIDTAEDRTKANFKPVIAKITENITDPTGTLLTSASSSADIASITGSSSAGGVGFLQNIVSNGSPEGINDALSATSGATPTQLNSLLGELTIPSLSSFIKPAITDNIYGDVLEQADNFKDFLDSKIGLLSGYPLIDLVEKTDNGVHIILSSLADTALSQTKIDEIYNLIVAGDYAAGFKILEENVDKPDDYDNIVKNTPESQWSPEIAAAFLRISGLEEIFNNINVQLTSTISNFNSVFNDAGENTIPVNEIGITSDANISQTTTPTSGRNSSGDAWSFEQISSVEELEAEFRSINRVAGNEIAGAIIHWAATFNNQDVGADWIHDVHKSRGFRGIGYHLVIRRDGSIQKGRPWNNTGAHDFNHNTNFLGFCFIGGINEVSSRASKPYYKYASVDSLTPAQFKAYDRLMRTFHKVFPHGQVAGHYMTSEEGKVDPGFDVLEYSETKFGHRNIILEEDPAWKESNTINLEKIKE